MTKDEIKAAARDIYALAIECRVPMLRACNAIGMAASTPHRWKEDGAEPGDDKMRKLRGSILIIAESHGTLPERHRAELLEIGEDIPELTKHRPATAIVRDLIGMARELEQSLAANA